MGTNSELSRNWMSLHIGRRRPAGVVTAEQDDEPQGRPLGAGTLDGEGSQPSRREKGAVSGAGRKCRPVRTASSFPSATKL